MVNKQTEGKTKGKKKLRRENVTQDICAQDALASLKYARKTTKAQNDYVVAILIQHLASFSGNELEIFYDRRKHNSWIFFSFASNNLNFSRTSLWILRYLRCSSGGLRYQ